MKLILMNPGYEEQIEVKEDLEYFNKCYKGITLGENESIRLTQTKKLISRWKYINFEERIIFINPKHWAKVEVIDD